MRTTATLTRLTATLTLALTVACSSMQRVPVDYINVEKPQVVHLANSHGVVTTVLNPTTSGDTVYGTAMGSKPIAVPLRQVESISTVRHSTGRTVALVAGATSITALVAYAVFTTADNDEDWYCDFGVDAREMNGGAPLCGPRNPQP